MATHVRPNPAFEPWFELRVIQSQVHYVTEAVAVDARRGCPVDTAELLGTIETSYPRLGVGRVHVGTDHWHETEFGSRSHVIRPRNKQALAWPGADHPVAKVEHPGTPEQPFMRPALYRKRRLPKVTR